MTAQLTPYLFFASNECREAMEHYQRVLGGDLNVMTMGDLPEGEDRPPSATDDMVMNAALVLPGGALLMASDDATGEVGEFSAFAVSIALDDAHEAARIFDELLDGGQAHMPFGPTFWSPAFGMGVDRFGVEWMVNVGDPGATS
jgi:PhnB protein